jgi:hypothetical protein
MLDTLRFMSVKPTTTRKNARRGRKADKSDDPKYLAKLVKDGHAIDIEDAKHVAKLVAEGALRLGKPIPLELLQPGPKAPSSQKAIRWMMRTR